AFIQASVLDLYDPDRARNLLFNGEIRSWGDFYTALREVLAQRAAMQGAGIHILTETLTSPTMADQVQRIQKLYPAIKWHQWEPVGPHNARAAAAQAFGQPTNTYYNVANANVIVSLDSDFLAAGPAAFRYARQFAGRRRVRG